MFIFIPALNTAVYSTIRTKPLILVCNGPSFCYSRKPKMFRIDVARTGAISIVPERRCDF